MAAFAELKAFITGDSTSFQAETKKAEGVASSFQRSVSSIGGMIAGAFSVGAIIAFGKSLLNTAHEMDKIAEATNLTMEQLVALKTIGAENGLSMDQLSIALGRVRDAQGKVVALSKPMEDALAALKINADDFVGAKTNDALAMIAKGFIDAGKSAEAFSAVKELLGRNSKDMIEMLIALDKEGLGPLADRTKDAAKGFEEMAKAQKTLEKAGNTVQLWSAKAVGAIERVGEALGRLSVEIEEKGFKKGLQDFFAFSEAGPEASLATQDFKKKPGANDLFTGDSGISNDANPDVLQRRRNKFEANRKQAEKERKEAQERAAYDAEQGLKKSEIIENYAKKIAGLKVKGEGENTDSLMKIGGLVGGSRPGVAVADRTIRIQTEQKELQREMLTELRKFNQQQMIERQRKGMDDGGDYGGVVSAAGLAG